MRSDSRLEHAWWTLRIGLGLGPLLAGLDKFFNLLANWDMYLNPVIPRLLHVSPATFMHLVGVVEIVGGRPRAHPLYSLRGIHRHGMAMGDCRQPGFPGNVP